MAEYPKELKYTKDHEWARKEGAKVVVGVTFHAQEALGDIVYVTLPKVGAVIAAGASFGEIESTKSVSELYAPISGKVTRINDALAAQPGVVNKEPYTSGWLVEIEPSGNELETLMDSATYEKLLASQK